MTVLDKRVVHVQCPHVYTVNLHHMPPLPPHLLRDLGQPSLFIASGHELH